MAKSQTKRKRSPRTYQAAANDQVAKDTNTEGQASGDERPSATVKDFTIPLDHKEITCRFHGPQNAPPALIFTHGAGGGLDNPATRSFSDGFAGREMLPVVGFQGTMNLKNRTKGFISVIDHIREQYSDACSTLALGGRSMGARAAVLAAQESENITALILVSYPLKSATGDLRDQILLDIPKEQSVLFVSGDNDNMCDLEELGAVRQKMNARSWLVTVAGADHGMSLKPKDAVEPLREKTGEIAAQWIKAHDSISTQVSLVWDKTNHLIMSHGKQHAVSGRTKVPKLKRHLTPPEANARPTKRGSRA